MKKLEAVVKPFKFDEIIEALKNENVQRFTVFEVKGRQSAGPRQLELVEAVWWLVALRRWWLRTDPEGQSAEQLTSYSK